VDVPDALPNIEISFKKNTRKTTTFHMEHLNQQSPKRVLNKGVGKKILPKGRCVMDTCIASGGE